MQCAMSCKNLNLQCTMLHSVPGTKDNCAAAVVQCSRHSYCYICSGVFSSINGSIQSSVTSHSWYKQKKNLDKGLLERTTYNMLKVDHKVNGRDGEGEEMEEAAIKNQAPEGV